ncbi:MAG TPA: ABC transporter permease [Candidatus Acidoferrales bacterium]|nr:ABC transporter permease [Candidatus Acidoferrales bacterium]
MLHDVRYGLRKLRRSPGFALLAVTTLALGIGANTAAFSLVYGVLLRPLSYPHSDRLVTPVWMRGSGEVEGGITLSDFRFWRDNSRIFQSLAAYVGSGFNLSGGGQPERVSGEYVSADFFVTLGVQPALGRDFLPAEDAGSGAPVVVLSHGLWQRQFGGSAEALGKAISLDQQPYTIIGVMPAGFASLESSDLWVPMARAPGPLTGGINLAAVGRLMPGIPVAQAQAGMALVAQAFKRTHPGNYRPGFGAGLIPLQSFLGLAARSNLLLLFGAIGLVLLIVCANVAGLLAARGAGRSREVALRLALGASRGRLVRQFFVESMTLALAGAVAGVPVAYGALRLLLLLTPTGDATNLLLAQIVGEFLPSSAKIGINGWSLAFALAAGVATAVVFGLLPAGQAVTRGVNETLKEGGLRSTAAAARARLRSTLVVAEMAVTMVLLAGALLLGRTFVNLLHAAPGFDPAHKLNVELWTAGSRYRTSLALADFYRSLTEKVDNLPGVVDSGVVSDGVPLTFGGNFPVQIEGVPEVQSVDFRSIDSGFFWALGVPLLAGRDFSRSDAGTSTPVAIVNRTFAQQYFGKESGLGRHVVIGAQMKDKAYLDPPREIVGVVGDVKSLLFTPIQPTVYVPDAQASYATLQLFGAYFPVDLVVHTTVDPLRLAKPVRRALASLDSAIPVAGVKTMDEMRSSSLSLERFMLTLMGIFAGLALALSAMGIYGLLSYTVTQRTAEIGLRMAVGATPADVLRMVLGHAAALAALGIALGAVGAFALTRLLGSVLYGVGPADPLSFAETAAMLAAVALAACAVPASRAMRVSPIAALRHE